MHNFKLGQIVMVRNRLARVYRIRTEPDKPIEYGIVYSDGSTDWYSASDIRTLEAIA